MSARLIQLQELTAELHEVNEELSEAARPVLERLANLNENQRREVAARLSGSPRNMFFTFATIAS